MHFFLNNHSRLSWAPKTTILLINQVIKMALSLTAKKCSRTKIRVYFLLFQNPFSELFTVLQFLDQLDFVSTKMPIVLENTLWRASRIVQVLTTVLNECLWTCSNTLTKRLNGLRLATCLRMVRVFKVTKWSSLFTIYKVKSLFDHIFFESCEM